MEILQVKYTILKRLGILKANKFVLILFGTLFLGCGQKILVDNSGPESWSFQLDDEKHTLAPGATEEISVEKGQHTLVFFYSGKDTLIEFTVSEEMFIHLPGQKYLLWRDLYGGQQNRAKILNEQEFEWDSVLYKVDVNWLDTNKFIHSKMWDFGIGEAFDEKIVLTADQNEGLRTRLLRIQDFRIEYQKRASRN
jgi:hypothetical protein